MKNLSYFSSDTQISMQNTVYRALSVRDTLNYFIFRRRKKKTESLRYYVARWIVENRKDPDRENAVRSGT